MIKRICAGVAASMVLIAFMCPFAVGGFNKKENNVVETESVTISEDYIPSEPSTVEEEKTEVIILEVPVVERVETTDLTTLSQKLVECESRKTAVHELAEAARALGCAEDHPIIILAKQEWNIANEDYKYYDDIYTPLKQADEERIRKEAEEAERKKKAEQQQAQKQETQKAPAVVTDASGNTYLGNFKLTAYCNCSKCCGQWSGGPTASGTWPVAGRTVATGGLAFGTKLLINGTVYTVEDRGTPYGHIDIYFNSHSEALQFGMKYANVYIVND